jgi:hypothetical protein
MRRPRRPSRPASSERRRPRSDPSWRSEPFNGTWTCRPSRVTTTATRRRSWRSNRPNVVSRKTSPSRPGRFAQSTRRSVMMQPPGPHRSLSFATTGGPRVSRQPGPGHQETAGVPAVSSPWPDPKGIRLLPALTCFDDECGAGERGEDHDHPEGLSLEQASHRVSPSASRRRP